MVNTTAIRTAVGCASLNRGIVPWVPYTAEKQRLSEDTQNTAKDVLTMKAG